jgi:HK97 gp10 family phage protein
MANKVIVTVDAGDFLDRLDSVPDALRVALNEASKTTANRIATEARSRIRRRTGRTAAAITVALAYRGDGYVVYVGAPRTFVGRFLEYGTKFMSPKPFLFASARLEEAEHQQRIVEAVLRVLDEKGLGE